MSARIISEGTTDLRDWSQPHVDLQHFELRCLQLLPLGRLACSLRARA